METGARGYPGWAGLAIKRGSVIQHRLNHVQRALMVIVVGLIAGNRFDTLCRVGHGERVARHFQHFCVIAAIANGDHVLRG